MTHQEYMEIQDTWIERKILHDVIDQDTHIDPITHESLDLNQANISLHIEKWFPEMMNIAFSWTDPKKVDLYHICGLIPQCFNLRDIITDNT